MEFKELRLVSHITTSSKRPGINLLYDRETAHWIVSRSKIEDLETGIRLIDQDILGVCPEQGLGLAFYDLFCKVDMVQNIADEDDPMSSALIAALIPALDEKIEKIRSWEKDRDDETYGAPLEETLTLKVKGLEELVSLTQENWHKAEAYLDRSVTHVKIPYTSLDEATYDVAEALGFTDPVEAIEGLLEECKKQCRRCSE